MPVFCFDCNEDVESDEHLRSCLGGKGGWFPVEETTDPTAEHEESRSIESAEGWGGPVQCCLLGDHDGPHEPPDGFRPEDAPDEDGPQEARLEVITGFIVALGRNGRPMLLPLDLRGVEMVSDRVATNRDIQAACREISDDLLAHRSAEYSELPAHLTAIADVLDNLVQERERG